MVQHTTEVDWQVVTLHIPILTGGEGFKHSWAAHQPCANRNTIKIKSGDD